MSRPHFIKPAIAAFTTWAAGIAVLALMAAAPAIGYAQETADITGRVLNGTAGASVPSGLGVFMLVSDESGSLVYSGQAETGPEGGFSFAGAAVVPGGRYLFNTLYSEVDYSQTLTWDQVGDGISLMVYETTEDISVVEITRQVLVIADVDPKRGMISALEFVRLSNTSDRALNPVFPVRDAITFLRFSLPSGTSELDVNSDLGAGEIISIGTGFAVTSPVLPGEHSIEYSFTFPYQDGGFSYRQNLLQGAAVYQVMAPQRLASMVVEPLSPAETVDIQGTAYRVWEIGGLGPRQGFTLEVADLPKPSSLARLTSTLSATPFWQSAIPVLLAVSLALVLGLGIATRPCAAGGYGPGGAGPGPGSDPVQDRFDDVSTTREQLIQQLAALDRGFELGQVPKEEYDPTRQALKARVLGLPGSEEGPADTAQADV